MKYLMLTESDQATLLGWLAEMPTFLERRFAALTAAEAAVEGPNQTFSPVEQCWHLADLEREGFGVRIRRLLQEADPVLPDFDGGRIARERQYRKRSLADGLAAFKAARESNLVLLRSLSERDWSRGGTQEGVGPIMLCDLPQMVEEHDRSHRAEIEAWSRSREGRPTGA